MQIVDPNSIKRKKAPAKPKGGEPYDAEPGLDKPSETWLDTQMAKLKLTLKTDQSYYRNYLPQLDCFERYDRELDHGPFWDEENGSFFYKKYLGFKISFRYYAGNKKRSYLFWPKHCSPGYAVRDLIGARHRQSNPNELQRGITFRVVRDSGWAEYAYVGIFKPMLEDDSDEDNMYYRSRRDMHVLALWRSEGTMKPRRTNERHVSWESDARTNSS